MHEVSFTSCFDRLCLLQTWQFITPTELSFTDVTVFFYVELLVAFVVLLICLGVPRRQSHRRPCWAALPSVAAIP